MSAITIDDDLVHYEVLGRGRPVILLHGWLGSWRYWMPAMRHLSMKYRTYALDLWGFGDSGRNTRRYAFAAQVDLVGQFMERLGITKAALIGHDLGASIATQYAIRHTDRVPRLMVICPPLFQMTPKSRPLTFNAPSGAGTPASDSAGTGDGSPAAPSLPRVHPEAETMPMRTEEMKERIRAELEKRARALGEARLESGGTPASGVTPRPAAPPAAAPNATAKAGKQPDEAAKSPREAAVPPAGQPAREIGGKPQPPVAPKPLDEIPQMPRLDYVPETPPNGERPNPLKEYLATTDRIALLHKHVEAGPDLDKLKVEIEKTDALAFSMTMEAFVEVDTLADLRALTMPSVMVYSDKDTFLPVPDEHVLKTLTDDRATFGVMALSNARHFPMLEDSAAFSRLLLAFLEAPDVRHIEVKDLWVRRVR